MKEKDQSIEHASLEEIKKQFVSWRRRKRHAREPIPPALWSAATRLAGKQSIYEVSRVLRIDYAALKRRVEQGPGGAPSEGAEPMSFLEIPLRVREAGGEAAVCVVKIEGRGGVVVTIEGRGEVGMELEGLGKIVWRRGVT